MVVFAGYLSPWDQETYAIALQNYLSSHDVTLEVDGVILTTRDTIYYVYENTDPKSVISCKYQFSSVLSVTLGIY